MEQLLLVTSCDSPGGIGASLRTDGRMDGKGTNGWTDRCDVGNSILDLIIVVVFIRHPRVVQQPRSLKSQ